MPQNTAFDVYAIVLILTPAYKTKRKKMETFLINGNWKKEMQYVLAVDVIAMAYFNPITSFLFPRAIITLHKALHTCCSYKLLAPLCEQFFTEKILCQRWLHNGNGYLEVWKAVRKAGNICICMVKIALCIIQGFTSTILAKTCS